MSDTVWLTYDSDENLTSIETPTHSATSLGYGDFRLPTKITDPLGNNSTIVYDANGNRQQQNLANASIITESVDEYGRIISSQHQSQITTFGYNPVNWGGDLTTIYDDDNNDYYLERVTKTGFIEKIYDRNNNNIEYSYNNAGLVTNVEYDDYSTEKYKYDGNYNLEYFVNRNGDTTHYEWYKNDLLKSVTNALGQTTSIEYYLTTYPKKYTYPDGRTDVLTYFKNGWLKSITDDMGTISYTYQANGKIATVTDRMNRIYSMSYDKDGRLTSITNPLGQVNQLTYNDRDLVSVTNAAGDATTYEYGNIGQFTKATDPLDKFNLMAYDDLLNLTSVTDANGHQTTIAYNNRSLPTRITLPTNDVFSITYDDEALVKTFTDAKGITATIYRNSNNQIKDIYYSNSEWSGFLYYPDGQLKKIQNNSTEQNFQYDKIGQLTLETGAFSETIQYVYDPITNYLTQVIYPSNKTITYSYSKGLISEVQDWNGNWAKYEYTNSSALQKVTYSNGIITNYTIDDLDQIAEQLSYKGNDTICYYHLTRNNRNLIVQITEKQPIMPAFAYKSATTTFDDADRPQSGGGSIFTNDANGNLLSFIDDTDTIGYSYAENNRITQSSYNGETITREHNALRKPVKLTQNGIETRYTFSNGLGLSKPIQQRDGSNNITQHYIYGADGLAWMVDGSGNAHFYHADYIGNIRALTNASGSITDSLACDPWSASVAHSGDTEQPFGYMGKYGVIHLGNTQYIVGVRDYIGALGRFVSADEYPANLANTQSNQRYSMAYNSPYNFVDPSGYLPKFATGGKSDFDGWDEFWNSWDNARADFGRIYLGTGKTDQFMMDAAHRYINADGFWEKAGIIAPNIFASLWTSENWLETGLTITPIERLFVGAKWLHGMYIRNAAKSVPNGKFYSTAFEMTLNKNLYPGVNASRHITAANKAMLSSMDNIAMKNLKISMKTRSNGSIIMNSSPNNWVWHHNIRKGIMQLVPKAQHSSGSIFWNTLHPGGKGGMSIWGGRY
jgi:RHS repeat-associated protein